MAVVTRRFEGQGDKREFVCAPERSGECAEWRISVAKAIEHMGGIEAAAEYGIKAKASDAGSGIPDAKGKIDASRRAIEGGSTRSKADLLQEIEFYKEQVRKAQSQRTGT